MSGKKWELLVVLCGLLACSFSATAGFNEALTAYQTKDFPTAISEANLAVGAGDARASFLLGVMHQSGQGVPVNAKEAAAWYAKAAQGGVVSAFAKLAQLSARGDGVPQSLDNAIAYARTGDKFGDPESSLFLYLSISAGPLNYLDTAGKPDMTKYRKLAARPISERTLDTEARDALYRAAAKNHPLAEFMLALAFGGTVGEGNRERMLTLAAKNPNHTNPALRNYEKIARQTESLGKSYVTPQLFLDTQISQTLAAMIKTCGISGAKKEEKEAAPELTAISIAKPLSGAVYLPSKLAGHEHAYLVAGEWEENWTYRGCGKTANLTIKFSADGLGGATMTSSQTPYLDEVKRSEL